jgi:nicotinamide-nucleotide amidase
MKAAVITIGSELAAGLVEDTNRGWICRELDRLSVATAICLTAPDSMEGIARALRCAQEAGPELVVVTGGLGPTADDLTASAIAEANGLGLGVDERAARMVAGAAGSGKLEPHQRKQAELPAGSTPIKPAGTAPGFVLKAGPAVIAALPGVPWEMRQMWPLALENDQMAALLAGASPARRRTLGFYGSGEPSVDEAVRAAFNGIEDQLSLTVCARYREVLVEISFPKALEKEVEASLASVRADLEKWYFSDGVEIEAVVADLLTGAGATLAVGESCTGGLLGAAITSVPGSSLFFRGGVVAYHNEVKLSLMGVRSEVLDKAGAVSEPVAQQLALGARSVLGSDYGIGITGVAGPDGGTLEKPVGLVFICASSEKGDVVERYDFPGGREDVRAAAVKAALHMLHRKLQTDLSQV